MNESEARLEALKFAKEAGATTIDDIVRDADTLAAFIIWGETISAQAPRRSPQPAGTRSKG